MLIVSLLFLKQYIIILVPIFLPRAIGNSFYDLL